MNQFFDEGDFPKVHKSLLPIVKFLYTPISNPYEQKQSFISNPILFLSLFSKKKRNTKEYISFKGLNDIHIEFLALICTFLDVTDIFSLAGVSKHLRNLLLDVERQQTLEIWNTSRGQQPFLDIPLPKGMNSLEFCTLTSLEFGCQFCNQRKPWTRIYWAYRVRSCFDCYVSRYISNSYLKKKPTSYSLEELKRLEENDKRRLEYIISFRKQRLSELIEELLEEVVSDNESIKSGYSGYSNDSGRSLFKYDPSILRKCPCINDEWKSVDQPFTLRDEERLKRKIDYEYQILSKHYTS